MSSSVRSAGAPPNGDENPSYTDLRHLVQETAQHLVQREGVDASVANAFHAEMVDVLNSTIRDAVPSTGIHGPNVHEPLPDGAIDQFERDFVEAYRRCVSQVDEPLIV